MKRHQIVFLFLVVVVVCMASAGTVWADEGVTLTPIPTSTPTPTPQPEGKSAIEKAKDIVDTAKKVAELVGNLTFPAQGPVFDFDNFFEKAVKTGTDFGKTWTSPESNLYPDFEDKDAPWNIWRESFSRGVVFKVLVPFLLVAIAYRGWTSLRKGESPPNIWAYLLVVILLGIFCQASGKYLAAVTGLGSSLIRGAGGQGSSLFPKGNFWDTLLELLLGISRGGKLMFLLLILASATFGLHLALKMIRRYIELFLAGTFMTGAVSASLFKEAFVTRNENPKAAIGWIFEFGRILLEIALFGVIIRFMLAAAVSKQLAGYAGWVIIAAIVIADKWPEKILAILGIYKLQERLQEADAPKSSGTAEEGLHVTQDRVEELKEKRKKELYD